MTKTVPWFHVFHEWEPWKEARETTVNRLATKEEYMVFHALEVAITQWIQNRRCVICNLEQIKVVSSGSL